MRDTLINYGYTFGEVFAVGGSAIFRSIDADSNGYHYWTYPTLATGRMGVFNAGGYVDRLSYIPGTRGGHNTLSMGILWYQGDGALKQGPLPNLGTRQI